MFGFGKKRPNVMLPMQQQPRKSSYLEDWFDDETRHDTGYPVPGYTRIPLPR